MQLFPGNPEDKGSPWDTAASLGKAKAVVWVVLKVLRNVLGMSKGASRYILGWNALPQEELAQAMHLLDASGALVMHATLLSLDEHTQAAAHATLAKDWMVNQGNQCWSCLWHLVSLTPNKNEITCAETLTECMPCTSGTWSAL